MIFTPNFNKITYIISYLLNFKCSFSSVDIADFCGFLSEIKSRIFLSKKISNPPNFILKYLISYLKKCELDENWLLKNEKLKFPFEDSILLNFPT
jgi:hypothetical protein